MTQHKPPFDVMSNSPCVSQGNTRQFEGVSSSSLEATFFPGNPSFEHEHFPISHVGLSIELVN